MAIDNVFCSEDWYPSQLKDMFNLVAMYRQWFASNDKAPSALENPKLYPSERQIRRLRKKGKLSVVPVDAVVQRFGEPISQNEINYDELEAYIHIHNMVRRTRKPISDEVVASTTTSSSDSTSSK